MARLVVGRIVSSLVIVLLVVSTCFVVIRIAPGDPFAQQLQDEGTSSEVRERLERAFGYDRSVPVQYLHFISSTARGELGWSHQRGQPVSVLLKRALPATMLLMGSALALGLALGIVLGAWQGWAPHSRLARASDRIGLLVTSIPEFILALLLMLGPALAWRWFPINGAESLVPPPGFWPRALDRLHHLALPALSLTVVISAVVARHQRAAMRQVADALFIRAGRARGLPEARLLWRHALRNSLAPVLTLSGLLLPAMVGGAVLVERIFGWPGMGSLLVDSVVARDYHVVVGITMFSSTAVVLGSLAADLALLWADPRQRR